MLPSFRFEDFATIVNRVAEETKRTAIIEGLKNKGAAYSLVDDTKQKDESGKTPLDSLDVTEVLMSLEEELQKLDGFEKLRLEGKEVDDAKNVGELYLIICKQLGITPQMPASAAA